jgi:DNA-directed RNA polymerase omega subunit
MSRPKPADKETRKHEAYSWDDTSSASHPNESGDGNPWPGIDSRYRLIVVAALRSKQLLFGATPRIAADPLKRRNTSIALEEVKRGLVQFKATDKDGNVEAEPPPSDGII